MISPPTPWIDIGRNTCGSTASIKEEFADKISAGNEYDIRDTAKNDCDITVFTGTAHLLVNESGYQCDKSFDHQCDRNIYKIAADQIRQCRTDTSGKHTVYRTKNDTCKDYDRITRMDITAGPGVGMRMDIVATQANAANNAVIIIFSVFGIH